MTQAQTNTFTQHFLHQLQEEAAITRKMLSVLPDDKFDWQPHPRSMSIQKLAAHIAELPGWITIVLSTSGLDIAKQGDPDTHNRAAVIAYFEKELSAAIDALTKASDEDLRPEWTMSVNGRVVSVRPKDEVIRMALSQLIHHRAQMGVFLRLLDIPIPGSYGPSADEVRMLA